MEGERHLSKHRTRADSRVRPFLTKQSTPLSIPQSGRKSCPAWKPPTKGHRSGDRNSLVTRRPRLSPQAQGHETLKRVEMEEAAVGTSVVLKLDRGVKMSEF